jgi:hypothetical protein
MAAEVQRDDVNQQQLVELITTGEQGGKRVRGDEVPA